MSKEKSAINVFQKYLTVWVILCMVIGILIGEYLPGIPAFLNQFEYAKVSVPMAILICYDFLFSRQCHFGKSLAHCFDSYTAYSTNFLDFCNRLCRLPGLKATL